MTTRHHAPLYMDGDILAVTMETLQQLTSHPNDLTHIGQVSVFSPLISDT